MSAGLPCSRVAGLVVSRVAGRGPADAIEFLTELGMLWLFDVRLVEALVEARIAGHEQMLVHDAKRVCC